MREKSSNRPISITLKEWNILADIETIATHKNRMNLMQILVKRYDLLYYTKFFTFGLFILVPDISAIYSE